MGNISFGWFLPTFGDTTAFGLESARIPPGNALFDDVAAAADEGGFQYLLMPVAPNCWEATIVGAYYAALTKRIAPLIAIRSGYVNPTQSAKMFATLDQISGGRAAINLIAGISDADTLADGIPDDKTVRYEKMSEEAAIMKRLWSSDTPIDYRGKHYNVNQVIDTKPLQQPHPPFFLGGGSQAAAAVSAAHSTVHLFWGERPSTIGEKIVELRKQAAEHGREDIIQFGMRLHVICRDSNDEAWQAAHDLIRNAPRLEQIEAFSTGRDAIADVARTSEANRQVWKLLEESGNDMKIHPHIWTGISTVRVGAGIAIVGGPKEVAQTIDEYVEAGCTSFCFSGYPHAEAARNFSEKVMRPHFGSRLRKGLPQDRTPSSQM